MSYPRVAIEYCTQCRWLLRASWLAQELLTTFPVEFGELALVPGTGGVFKVSYQESAGGEAELLFSRADVGRFPEPKEIKQLLRDRVDPERDLGHSDRK